MSRIIISILIGFVIYGCTEKVADEEISTTDYSAYMEKNDLDIAPELTATKEGEDPSSALRMRMDEFVSEYKNGSPEGAKPVEGEYIIMVNEEGGVDKIAILNSLPDEMNSFVLKEMKGWNFKPAEAGGTKVKAKYNWKYVENDYFAEADEMPVPIGGISEIGAKIKYPDQAKESGIQGKVILIAYISEQGVVEKTEILKGIGSGCDQAASDAVKATKFSPGIKDGMPVKTQVTIPIVFKLQ